MKDELIANFAHGIIGLNYRSEKTLLLIYQQVAQNIKVLHLDGGNLGMKTNFYEI